MSRKLCVGFSRVDISPLESVPLEGYGNTHTRMSQGILDPIMATCLAFTDEAGNTMLLMTVDHCVISGVVWPVVLPAIEQKHGLKPGAVVVAATHTHSSPACYQPACPSAARYTEYMIQQLILVADQAMDNRTDAALEIARTQNQGLNYVRHYLMEDGSVAGDNFGDYKTKKILRSITEPDRNIQLIKIKRQDERDILMVNWQAHPALASTSTSDYGKAHRPFVSADYVGVVRKLIEEKTGMYFAFFQGACGNINSRSYNPAETVTKNHEEYGAQLADYILKGMEGFQPIANGNVSTRRVTFHGKVNHTEDHLLDIAKEISALWQKENNYRMCADMGKPYGINSPYHANSIIAKAGMAEYLDMNIGAGAVGNVGFAFIPYEPFDTNGMFIKEHSPFEMTFVLGYANGYYNYVPSKLGFEYSCYETNSCKHIPGTGEAVADSIVDMLKQLHDQA